MHKNEDKGVVNYFLSNLLKYPHLPAFFLAYMIFSVPKQILEKAIEKQYSDNISEIEYENHRKAQELQKQREEEQAKRQAIARREQEEREAYRKQLQEIEDKEYAKTRGQSRALLSLYEQQLKLLQEHKKRGMDIERETFDLRKKLLELERQENSEMINDLLQTLDRVSK